MSLIKNTVNKRLSDFLISDLFVMVLIIINSIIILLYGFEFDQPIQRLLLVLDQIITVFFISEALIKINQAGFGAYWKINWNKFDFIIVLIAVPSLLEFLMGLSILHIEFLVIFRIFRLFKFFRLIQFVPRIHHLMKSIFVSIKSSFIVLASFLLLNFVIGIVSFYLFGEIDEEHFGDPLSAFYSIFKVFTIEGWYEIPDELTTHMPSWQSFLVRTYFIIILLVGGIFGLSIVNAIFVDNMVADNNDELIEKVNELEQKIDILIAQNNSSSNNI